MSENARYRLLQGGYWMLFCAGYGYVTVYLLDWGYAAAQIGAVTAVFGLLAALGQPVLGKIADIMNLPANNVYVVRGGEREILVPAVPQFIAETNVEGGYLRVNMMEGL